MTFEEFFLKKKIDLELFRQGDPNLFDEFVSHYEVMSEKSFDHTKKYWFNNLRHIYPLSEVKEAALKQAVKAVPPGEKPENETVAPTVTTTIKAPAFKPRFKVKTTEPGIAETAETHSEETESVAPKPTGFKPRFKAGASTVAKSEETAEKAGVKPAQDATPETPNKPAGFKPRFKAGVTGAVKYAEPIETKEETKSVEESAPQEPTSKPAGFKPRFKAGVTGAVKSAEPIEAKEETKSVEESAPQAPANKPAGFKPRFKAVKKEE